MHLTPEDQVLSQDAANHTNDDYSEERGIPEETREQAAPIQNPLTKEGFCKSSKHPKTKNGNLLLILLLSKIQTV